MHASNPSAEIRRARLDDAPEIARLSGELGYPMSVDEMAQRLEVLLRDERHHVAVVGAGERLFAWMHVEQRASLERGERAELMGLIVDTSARRHGWGRKLADGAEGWARERGLGSITVRSNVARDLSHPFYESLGYERSKTQHVYTKAVRHAAGATAHESPSADLPKYALLEIERRWLADLGAVHGLAENPHREIEDLYIEGCRLRLRKITGPSAETVFKLGKKYGKRGCAEPVTNVYLSQEEYERLSSLPGERTRKRRYSMAGGSLDVYLEPVEGVAVFEIEFRDERAAASYQPPRFALREITHDDAFSGAALARRPGAAERL
jgi:GNAT superfamily N-acetyltransferase/CYTH domain-containing protein